MTKCDRCGGQVLKDWEGRVCIQCGFRPDDVPTSKGKEPGRREPRLFPKRRVR